MSRILLSSCLSIAIASLSVSTVKAEDFPIITRLQVREGTVLVSRGFQGKLKYSLIDRQGNQIETNIPEALLAKKYPALYDRLNPAVADTENEPWAGTFLDYER